jgi:hypothetical protein
MDDRNHLTSTGLSIERLTHTSKVTGIYIADKVRHASMGFNSTPILNAQYKI